MLVGQLGIRLILLLGKTVPLPASGEVMGALSQVEVTNDSELGDGFKVTLTLGRDGAADYGLLRSGAFDPFNRVVIGVALGPIPQVLIDGIVAHHQLAPGDEPGTSTLTVMGTDLRQVLDLEEKNEEYKNQPDFVIFNRIVAGYAQYGLVPQATPTTDVPVEIQRIPRQHETDLKFVERLAKRNGFVFYIEPVTVGVNRAYFGPELRTGLPQPALSVGLGSFTNVNRLSFSQDALSPESPGGSITDSITKTSIPIPSLPPLKLPPLALSPTPARRKTLLRETANESPVKAAVSAVAKATNAPDPVKGEGELDTVRYGHVLRARSLVGVRGVGASYGGNYYVRSVKHLIARESYAQQFTISREGTGALLPVVRP